MKTKLIHISIAFALHCLKISLLSARAIYDGCASAGAPLRQRIGTVFKISHLVRAIVAGSVLGSGSVVAQPYVALPTGLPPVGAGAIAASTNGARLIAFGVGGSGAAGGGGVWTSTNSGATWVSNVVALSDYETCYSVASSADGTKLSIATSDGGLANHSGSIYYSTNGGTTWRSGDAPYTQWNSIACSADGSKMVAGYSHLTTFPNEVGGVYLSANYGANWTAASLPDIDFVAVASSVDGSKLLAASELGEALYVSTTAGASWTKATLPAYIWHFVAASADGNTLFVAEDGEQGPQAPVYSSTNAGVSWNPTASPTGGLGNIKCSADGTRLLSESVNSYVYSTDSGASWTDVTPIYSKKVAATNGLPFFAISGYIFTVEQQPSLQIGKIGTNAIVSWQNSSPDFVLEQTTNFFPANWSPVTNATSITGSVRQVRIPISSGNKFFGSSLGN